MRRLAVAFRSMFDRSAPLAAALLALALAAPAGAATSVTLPAWVCKQPDVVFQDVFDAPQAAVPHDPSLGSGGAYPGSQTRTLHVAGLGSGTQNYYLYLPADYTPARAWPLMLVLHGVAPYGSADSYAMTTRDNWVTAASAGHFIVVAPVADDVIYQNGSPYAVSWLLPYGSEPSDYDLFDAVRADVEAAYNIERTRIYAWGFSAGGHVLYDLALTEHDAAFNTNTLAAFAVTGADLAAVACAGLTDAGCNQLLAMAPRRVPLDIHIGNSDPNYSYAKSDHLRFVAQGWVDWQTVWWNVFVGGHTYTVDQLGAAWSELCPDALTP